MRWIKDLHPGMSGVTGALITGLRNSSVSGLNLPTPSWTDRHGHPSSFAQRHGTFVLVTNSELSFSCICMKALQLVHLFLMGSGCWVIFLFNFTTFLKRPLSSDTQGKLIQALSP